MRRTFLASGAAAAASAAVPAAVLAQGAPGNPVSTPWAGPYGGVPAFDKVRTEDFKPAIEAAIEERRREIRALTVVRSAPTFENTVAALENGGRTLDRATTIYGVIGGNMSTPEFRLVEKEVDPQLSALSDEITQNPALFSRIETVSRIARLVA